MGKKPKISDIKAKRLEEYKPGASRKTVLDALVKVANTKKLKAEVP